MSELSICETVGERGAGSNKRWFPHFIHTNYLLYTEMLGEVGGGYNSGGFPISYYITTQSLMYVFDFVCFIPSKYLTLM